MNASSSRPGLDRRAFVSLAAGSAALFALSACTTPQGAASTSGVTGLGLPKYVAPPAIAGAKLGDSPAVIPAFSNYPRHPKATVLTTIGKGETVTTFQPFWGPPPPALSSNAWWQGFNDRLGLDMKIQLTPQDAYPEKLPTLIASGQLPDITWIDPDVVPSINTTLRQGAFQDLTPILAGDGVLEYPNLSHVATTSWKNMMVDGKIFGVPRQIPLVTTVPMYRADWAAEFGVTQTPKTADEYYDMMVGFSKHVPKGASGPVWGFAGLNTMLIDFAKQMFGVPNKWRLTSGGKLVNELETEEFVDAITYVKKLWDGGAFNPDAVQLNAGADAKALFTSGRAAMQWGSYNGFLTRTSGQKDKTLANVPDAELKFIAPPTPSGHKAVAYASKGSRGFAAISAEAAKDKDKLTLLLNVLNYWAAPFGSEEYLFINYGEENKHYSWSSDDQLVVSPDQALGIELYTGYGCQPFEANLFYPGAADTAFAAQANLSENAPKLIEDPTLGLYSATAVSTSGTQAQLYTDYAMGIITGRRPISDITEWRSRWKSGGGNATRTEFQRAIESKK